ncbi:MAG: hypothetical protein JXA78_15060, partial [Anaerolineales bacterium]|nr:hypothetical protein [Anaerolineales bacterium]
MRKTTVCLALAALLFTAFSWRAPQSAQSPQMVDPVQVLESSAERLVLGLALPEMTLEDVRMSDGNPYTLLSVEDAAFAEPGKPGVPVFAVHILVPNGRTPSLVVEEGEAQIYPTNYTLSPLPLPAADLEDSPVPAFYIDEAAYANPYPGVWAELGPVEVMRGQQTA